MDDAAFDLFAYVSGPYARVEDERSDADLEVEGELPAGLRGSFVQNQANPRFEPQGFYHWFDGDGMVHGVEIADGRATYRNRYVRTSAYAQEDAAGRSLGQGILSGFDPAAASATPWGQPDKDTANTDLVWFDGRLLATWWLSGQPYRLSLPDLATVGAEPAGVRMSAHPKVDPRRGELRFIDFDVYGGRPLSHGVMGADGAVRVTEVPGARSTLYHDIAISENYTIILDLPMAFDAAKLRQGKRRVRFLADQPARFAVVHRATGEVRWFEASPCYCYHTVNAWEEVTPTGVKLHLLACRIAQPTPSKSRVDDEGVPRLFHLRLEPFLHRWTFDLTTGAVTEQQLDDTLTEFPRIDDRYLTRPSRYAFHPRLDAGPTLLFDALIRYDLEAGTHRTLAFGPDRVGAEAVFAPRPGSTDEGDGWLIHFQTDRAGQRSELVVIDAVALEVVARVKLPRRVPFAFHAEWAPAA